MRANLVRSLTAWYVIGLALLGATSAVAMPIVVPTALNPGDQYRLAFVSSTTRNATSTDIADYNAHVTSAANAVAELLALGTTWYAIGSTATVDAINNTKTDGSVPDVPIYLLNDVKLVDGNFDLWDGLLDFSLNLVESGAAQLEDENVWTGTLAVGGRAQFPLGSTFPTHGETSSRGDTWVQVAPSPSHQPRHLYALSDILSVANAAPTTEPATLAILVVGAVGCLFRRRRRA